MNSDTWHNTKKLQKVYIEFDDPASGLMQYQMENLEGDGLSIIRLPFDLSTFATNYVKMEFYERATAEPVIVEGLDKLKYLLLDAEVETYELREWKRSDSLLDELNPGYLERSADKFPAIQISDVTNAICFSTKKFPKVNSATKAVFGLGTVFAN